MRLLILLLALVVYIPIAQAQPFKDVPANHVAAPAITDLVERGSISGYQDGTYRLGNLVNRAEAIKLLVSALFEESEYAILTEEALYEDVPVDIWYGMHAAFAHNMGAIDGPPKRPKFEGDRPVLLAEFLKMLFLLDKQDIEQYHTEEKPIAEDVNDQYAWYYPYIGHAVTTTMITNQYPDEKLYPGKELTRADVALYLHRYLMYREGKHIARAQAVFASQIDQIALDFPELSAFDRAEQISYRLILLANGMLEADPDSSEFLAYQKVSWAFGKIFLEEYENALTLFKESEALSADVYQQFYLDIVSKQHEYFSGNP